MTKFKVPRLYRAAAKVAKVIKEENGKLEDLVQENNKKTNVKALAALVNKCLNNEKMLDTVINNSEILVKEKFDNVWVVRILITELLIGKHKLPIGSPTIQTILAYGPVLKTEHLKAQGKHRGKGKKHGGALKAEEGENSESELIEEPTEGSEQAKSGSKAPLKRKRSNAVSEGYSKNQNSKSKKRKGENERYFELKAEDSDKVLEEHKGPGTKKAKKKKRKHAAEENDDKPTPDTITLDDDAIDEGKPLWGKQKDYIKIEDASIKSKFDQPKKKKKSYPVKKDKFSAEKKFSKFQKKFKKGKNKFNRDN